MSNTVEKSILLVLGAVAGIVVGFIILSLPFMILSPESNFLFVFLMGVIGILVTIIILFHKREEVSRESHLIRNETVALITHEMRTALTSTSWAIQFVLKTYNSVLTETDKKMLEDIVNSIHTTVMHTVNLLDISLLDIGKLSISLEWVALEKVQKMIEEVIEKYKMGIEKEGIGLTTSIKLDQKDEVEIDTLRLRIILENLLENSIQYCRNDKKEIKMDVSNTPTTLKIIISDTGIGIPKGEQANIFSEFYRASNARKTLSSGSGIGLYLCAQYVKAHHGTIRFESKEGEGTTFFIALPLKTSADVNEFLVKV